MKKRLQQKETRINLGTSFFDQVQAIEYNHLRFCVPKECRQQGKGVEHPSSEKRRNAQYQAIEFAVNHCW